MKKLAIVVIVLIILIQLLCGCADNSETNTNPLSNLEWSSSEYGVGFNPPEAWDEDPNVGGGFPIVRFFGPKIQGYTYYALSLSIFKLLDLNESETLSSFAEMQIKGLEESDIFDEVIVYNKTTSLNGMNAYEYVYTYNTEYSSNTFEIRSFDIYVEKNREIYLITYIALDDIYTMFKPTIDDSIETLVII